MALRKKIPTRKKLNADQIVSEICNQMVGELSSAPESDCLNLSSYSSPTSLRKCDVKMRFIFQSIQNYLIARPNVKYIQQYLAVHLMLGSKIF